MPCPPPDAVPSDSCKKPTDITQDAPPGIFEQGSSGFCRCVSIHFGKEIVRLNHHSRRQRLLALVAVCSVTALPGFAQTPPPSTTPPAPRPQGPQPDPQGPLPPGPQGPQAPRRLPAAAAGTSTPAAAPPTTPARPKPYSEVITDKAKTQNGLFKVHQIDEKVYWEIPTSLLGKEILWVTTLRQTQQGYQDGGGREIQDRVVRFEKREDRILMRAVSYQARPDVEGAMKQSLELDSVEPILMTFDVKAYNNKAGDAPVVDVTSLLTGDVAEFSPRQQLGGSAHLDAARTFLDRIKALPTNIEVDVLATYTEPASAGLIGLPSSPRTPRPADGPGRDRSTDAISVVLHHSIVALPAVPMEPRLYDDRIGYFTTGFYEFGSPENRVKEVEYINRWRLEKKDPNAALSEPVKPIVYYIGPEVPAKWRPYLKQAVEDWQPAFEQAGFKNAIIAKDAPTKAEDPDFDPDDIRYNVIRWLPSATENAYGPHISDPRTGEILNADIKVYYNLLKLAETWYFTQASPSDPRAHTLPLPDDLVGRLLRYAVSHEVGHTLGLRHNFIASSAYSIAELRSPQWTQEWGDEASIMDYGRFDYVAQPGDNVRLIPKQGPYDLFAIEWGYRPISAAATPDSEKSALNALASRQISNPMLRFGPGPEGPLGEEGPHEQREDLGDDPLTATALGLKNIDRVMAYIVPATEKEGEDYDRLKETYGALLNQRDLELDHVSVLVGGIIQTNNHYNEGSAAGSFRAIPAATQRAAVRFLIKNAFVTPKTLMPPSLTRRLDPTDISAQLLAGQVRVLARLTEDDRLQRLADWQQVGASQSAYGLPEMMDDVRKGVWSELSAPTGGVVIAPARRQLQQAYITLLGAKLAPGSGTPSSVRPIVRGELIDTKRAIQAALTQTSDRETTLHLLDAQETLQQILFPKDR